MKEELRKLVEKWRAWDPGDSGRKNEYYAGRAHGAESAFEQAAEELEAVLSRAEEPEQAARERLAELRGYMAALQWVLLWQDRVGFRDGLDAKKAEIRAAIDRAEAKEPTT